MMQSNCSTCRWSKLGGHDFKVECRRYPPGADGTFRLVGRGDWCGEWRMPEPTDIYAAHDLSQRPRHPSWNGVLSCNECDLREQEEASGRLYGGPAGGDMTDAQFLEWVADRFVHVYGVEPGMDYVCALRRIATTMRAAEKPVRYEWHDPASHICVVGGTRESGPA